MNISFLRLPAWLPLAVCLLPGDGLAKSLKPVLSLTGSVHRFNPGGDKPLPESLHPVHLIRGADTLRGTTDSFGKFAFYGLDSGAYLVEIPKGYGQVYRQKVSLPAWLKPVILPPALPPPPGSGKSPLHSANPIRIHSDYEAIGEKRYRFSLWAEAPDAWKPRIREVRFFMNHPSFTRKYLVSKDPGKDFRVSYVGWGCLVEVEVEIFFEQDAWKIHFPFCEALKEKVQKRKS